MHSRIVGMIEKDFYDQHIDDYSWKLDYDDNLPWFADYVDDDTDIDKDFMWLVECITLKADSSLIDIDDKELTIKFHKGFKEAYFRDAWETLIKKVIGDPEAFEKFCGVNDKDDFVYRCEKCLNEKFEFYIADEYGGYETLDQWLRRINYDTVYKCFDSVDYHF